MYGNGNGRMVEQDLSTLGKVQKIQETALEIQKLQAAIVKLQRAKNVIREMGLLSEQDLKEYLNQQGL